MGLPNASRSFACSLLPHLERLNLTDATPWELDLHGNVTFVTAASEDHFLEARAAVLSTKDKFPRGRLVFYGLELARNRSKDLTALWPAGIVYRDFSERLKDYPSHFANTVGYFYYFKAAILAETAAEFGSILWIDASIRWEFPKTLGTIKMAMEAGEKAPVLMLAPSVHSIFAATHPHTYDVLPMVREEAKAKLMGCSCFVLFRRSDVARQVLKWHLLCALNGECWLPTGSRWLCLFKRISPTKLDLMKQWAGCHSFEQSSLALALHNVLPGRPTSYYSHFKGHLGCAQRGSLSPKAHC